MKNAESRGAGDPQADELFRSQYQALRRLARSRLRRSEDITLLDTTSLVHESWLRMHRSSEFSSDDEGRFLGCAARVMRFVVVDHVRQRHAERRGGANTDITLSTDLGNALGVDDRDVIRIHEALEQLAAVDPRLTQVVEMRCFAGLDEQAIGLALGVTERTIRRNWQKALLLLRALLSD
jgi:RNA polymerase sigma factor (TIGR02999 family)